MKMQGRLITQQTVCVDDPVKFDSLCNQLVKQGWSSNAVNHTTVWDEKAGKYQTRFISVFHKAGVFN